jgi:hypothetical protein
MRYTRLKRILPVLLLAAFIGGDLAAQQAAPDPDPRFATPEGLIEAIYEMVTFEAGAIPNWDDVRSTFLPEAIVVLFASRTNARVMSVDGFILDWYKFLDESPVKETGFSETIVRMESTVFNGTANIWVLYESQIPGSARGPQPGVDNFSLVKRDGRWWIASIVNDIPTPDNPIPDVLQN